MAQATFYTFSKRGNSTAVPTGAGTAVDVVLKDGTSLIDPVFLLQLSTVPAWSMMLFEGRYYKITNITSVKNDLWEVAASVDVLATYKANIQAASAFVAYDTSANTEITDRRLSIKTTAVRSEAISSDAYEILTNDFSNFAAIVNVVGEKDCSTIATTVNNAKNLLNNVKTWADDIYEDVTSSRSLEDICEILYQIGRCLISAPSAADCIKSSFLLPVKYALLSGTPTDSNDGITLGLFPTEMQGKIITQRWLHDGVGVTIPWPASDWRRNAPFTEVYLYIPFIGVVSYPASALINATSLYVDFGIDVTNGDTIIKVSLDSVGGQVIGQYTTNLSIAYAIGASNITPTQTVTSIAAGAAGVAAIAATGGAAGAIAAGTAGIVGELNAVTPIPSSIGSAGGGAVLGIFGGSSETFKLRCMTIFHDTNVSPDSVSAIIGTPTNAVKSLAGLSGYVETRNFSVSGSMTERERQEINRLMDGGIYIE